MRTKLGTLMATLGATLSATLIVTSLAQAADLSVHVGNVQADGGRVMLAVYDKAADFLKRPARQQDGLASNGSATLVVKDLAPGEYAVAVFHDANANGKLDANPMGIPIEPIGFSNDAMGHMGPPAWDVVKFTVPAGGAAIELKLR
jgi:uncharacterized protein (DUF2141 family)